MPNVIEIIGGFLSAFGLYGVCSVLSDVTSRNSEKRNRADTRRDFATQTAPFSQSPFSRSTSVPNIEPMYKKIFRNMSYPTLPYK
jgi:hypothetical protein